MASKEPKGGGRLEFRAAPETVDSLKEQLKFDSSHSLSSIEEVFRSCTEANGLDYLKRVSSAAHRCQGKTVTLSSPPYAMLKIGGLDNTMYQGEHNRVKGWGNFYLPNKVNMEVVGVVDYPCQTGQLVVMTCEDKTLFVYDGEELHVVASSLMDVFTTGLTYPGTQTFYRGERFKDMTLSDWEQVRKKSSVWKKMDQAYRDEENKDKESFMASLEVIRKARERAKAQETSGGSAGSKRHFVDQHWATLIQRVTSVTPLLDELLFQNVITVEMHDTIRSHYTPQEQMRALYAALSTSGKKGKDILYEILKKDEPMLISDLL